ncbi:patatin-like phospholipase family protein [Pseudochelatococcus sp. G4_1912]|uniref:patatin-like phospholipase family protein n=1 Tax=Pseudochelatococcus sp. G4_1912 TaxID=3114288 RepID=UPI0039C6A661
MRSLDGYRTIAFNAPDALCLDIIGNSDPSILEKLPVQVHPSSLKLEELVDQEIEEQAAGPQTAQLHETKMVHVVESALRTLPPEQQATILSASQAHLHQIMQDVLVPSPASPITPGSEIELRGNIQQASRAAEKALESNVCHLVEEMLTKPLEPYAVDSSILAADAIHAPKIYRRHDGTFNLIRAVPPIENLILPGGGAKGIGLAGALMEMENAGMLSGLRSLAGSSAGALVVTWLSVGRSVTELGALLGGNFRNLLDTNDALNKVYPDIQFRSTAAIIATLLTPFGAGHDTATGMIKKLDEVTSSEVRAYLSSRNPEELSEEIEAFAARETVNKAFKGEISFDKYEVDDAISERIAHIQNRFAVLQQAADFTKSRQGKMVTFDDMAVLHALAPEKFKSVRITAHDLATRDNVIFSEENAPSFPIAYAARASMAHPLIATGVTFSGFNFKGANHLFSDGGISSNVPVEALVPTNVPLVSPKGLPTPAYQRLRAATAVMAFDEDGHATKMINKSPTVQWNERGIFTWIKDAIVNGVSGWVASNPEMAKDYLADMQKIHDYGVNTLVVKHGDISSLDVDASCKRKGEAIMLARISLQEQLKIVRGDSYAVEVGSIKEAFDLLDDREKELILAAGPSVEVSFSSAFAPEEQVEANKKDADSALHNELYALVAAEHERRQEGRIYLMM